MIKRKALIVFSLILVLIFPMMVVNAESPYTTTDDALKSTDGYYNAHYEENTYVTLASGKLLVAYPDNANGQYLFVKIFTMGGVEQSSTRWLVDASQTIFDVSVYYVSETVVYIFVACTQGGNPAYLKSDVIKFNPTALTYTTIKSSQADMSSDCDQLYNVEMQPVFKNGANNHYYSLVSYSSKEVGSTAKDRGIVYLVHYTPDSAVTNTVLLSVGPGAVNYINAPYWFQETSVSNIAYVIFERTGLAISYYKIDMTALTATILVAHPYSADGWIDREGDAVFSRYLGGKLTQVNTTYYILQHTWIKSTSYGGYVTYRFVNYIGTFYNMTTAGYIAGFRDSITWSTSISRAVYGAWNYGIRVDNQHFTMYYLDYLASLGGYIFSKVQFTLNGVYETDDLTLSYVFTQPCVENLPTFDLAPTDTICIAYNMSSSFAVGYNVAIATRIYYGLATVETMWDILLTYSPVDYPLITSKAYTYTVTTKANGLNAPEYFKVFIDDIFINYYQSSALTGTKDITITFMSSGNHEILISIYNPAVSYNTSLHSETFYYSVIDADEADDDQVEGILFSQAFNLLVVYLPLIIVIFVPALEGAKLAGGYGFIAGGMIGTILGAITGIVPMYVIYLLVIVIVIALVWVIKGNIGGNNNG